jgi:hypothetical protein
MLTTLDQNTQLVMNMMTLIIYFHYFETQWGGVVVIIQTPKSTKIVSFKCWKWTLSLVFKGQFVKIRLLKIL